MNFDRVREYQPGDDVRAIDWNVTARMNRHPFIKKFVEERELHTHARGGRQRLGPVRPARPVQTRTRRRDRFRARLLAIRNNDKGRPHPFSDEVEKFIPPRKAAATSLRVIRGAGS